MSRVPPSYLSRPLARSTLSEEVSQRIAAAIRDQELAPGTRLVEAQLARTLGVSRAPVRDALQQLVRTGLVVSTPDGYRAPMFDMRDLRELLQLRMALEQLAARLIAENGSAPRLERLEPIIGRMRKVEVREHDGADVLSDLDRQFHRLLCVQSGNPRLVRCWDEMAEQINLALVTTNRAFPGGEGFARDHELLLRPIADGNRAACDAAIEDHILGGLRRYEADRQTQLKGLEPRSVDQKGTQ